MYKALALSVTSHTVSSRPTWLVGAFLLGVAACCWFLLAWLRTDDDGWKPRLPRFSRDQLRTAGWAVGLLVLAVSMAVAATSGNAKLPTYVAVVALWLVIACAPLRVRPLLPFAAIGIGLAGIVVAALASRYLGAVLPGVVARRFSVWRLSLLVQSVAFLAVGLWLIWRRRNGGPARFSGSPGRSEWRRLGLLLLPAAALLALLIYQRASHGAWIAAAAAVALALIVVVALPSAAPDLAAVALTVLGLCALGYALSPPMTMVREVFPSAAFSAKPSPGGAGFASAAGAAFRGPPPARKGIPGSPAVKDTLSAPAVKAAGSAPAGKPITQVTVAFVEKTDGPLELMAGLEGAAILALGIWLIPRTIGVRARTLLRPDTELEGRVEQLTQTRADAVDTAAAELRRVERDLHDGAQARLVALGMSLRAAERLIPTSPQAAIALVAEARETSSKALTELRALVRGMYPPVLADRGLADAVRALALDTPLRTETDIDLPGRLDLPVESACYFAIAEALTNAVKHSGARLVQIRIRHAPRPAPGMLRIEVTDNGSGGADPGRGSGLQGVERRLATFDGILAVSSPPGGPTMIVMEIPCALSSQRTSSC
jgi:signal transduction histidine kinase